MKFYKSKAKGLLIANIEQIKYGTWCCEYQKSLSRGIEPGSTFYIV